MNEKEAHILQMRWLKIEGRYGQLNSIKTELDEINHINEVVEQTNLRETKAYMLIELEMNLLEKEQLLIEKTGALKLNE